jgi:hypothetical protein
METQIVCELCIGVGCAQCEERGYFLVEIFDEPIEVIEE